MNQERNTQSCRLLGLGFCALLVTIIGLGGCKGLRLGGEERAGMPPSIPTGWKIEKKNVKVATGEGDAEREITLYTNTIGMRLVPIPQGSFGMGEGGDGGPQTFASAFYMGAYEVTNGQYQRFLRETGYDGRVDTVHDYMRHYDDWGKYASTEPEYPIVFISWRNARKFCEWLSQKEGVCYRLPSEAEWEYACRAGSTTRYYWGDSVRDDCAWWSGNSGKTTHPVGRKLPNAFGLHDMSGNVEEFCQSLHRSYPYRADDGREDLHAAGYRVLRGGSWAGSISSVGSAERYYDGPAHPYVTYGFRVVVSLKGDR